jgi:hypothetical protein
MIPLLCPAVYFGACTAQVSSIEWGITASEGPSCDDIPSLMKTGEGHVLAAFFLL